MSQSELGILILGVATFIMAIAIWIRLRHTETSIQIEDLHRMEQEIRAEMAAEQRETIEYINQWFKTFSTMMQQSADRTGELQQKYLKDMERQLADIRLTVDERLQKTLETRLGQSFQLVSERLEQVQKGLGEMQTLATGVGDLKKVLSNVKTRGILGEIQLAAILDEILAPEQYEKNVNTRGEGSNVVEFAVKLPGETGRPVYLPIDSKFPGDAYGRLVDAYDAGDPGQVAAAQKALIQVLRQEAKDIRDKYVSPPNTTAFAILFLPVEGLYAEVCRLGLVETLQREYQINIAGPTTMAALLNSLQMGFRTLAIQKRTNEVWEVLGAVKTEFAKFEDLLEKAQRNLNQAGANLDQLMGTRTRAIQRKLRQVTELPEGVAGSLLEIDGEAWKP